MRRVLFGVAVFLICACVGAQENNRPRAFDAIRSSDSYRQAVLGAYQDYESGLSTHCQKIDINMNTSEAKIYGTIQTDADGNIVNGSLERDDGWGGLWGEANVCGFGDDSGWEDIGGWAFSGAIGCGSGVAAWCGPVCGGWRGGGLVPGGCAGDGVAEWRAERGERSVG